MSYEFSKSDVLSDIPKTYKTYDDYESMMSTTKTDRLSLPSESKPKISKYWIISMVLWGITVFVIVLLVILWQTGVIFKSEPCKSSEKQQLPSNIEALSKYEKNSIEQTILKVPEYNPNALTREEEYKVTREKPVLDQLNVEVLTERSAMLTKSNVEEGPVETKHVESSHETMSGFPSFSSEPSEIFHGESLETEEEDEDDGAWTPNVSTPRNPSTPKDFASSLISPPESGRRLSQQVLNNNGLDKFIEHILYINLDDDRAKRENVEQEILKLGLPDCVQRERLSAVKRSNGPLGNFLSHIACLSKALILKKNVLILEDEFKFDRTSMDILEYMQSVEDYCDHRWDVICFSQKIDDWQFLTETKKTRICRILHNTSTCGYLVNKLYVPRLVAFWIQKLRMILQKEKFSEEYHIEHVQTDLQKSDLWIGFHIPIGHRGEEKWRYLDDLQHAINPVGVPTSIRLQESFVQKSVAVCHLATGTYNQYVPAIQKDCYLKFLKIHRMEFFLFTDEANHYAKQTEEGALLHTYSVDSKGYSNDNLYRFHYLLQAEEELKKFDYIYYMDVDYRIYQHPAEHQLMVDGIVATAHLHNIVEKRDGSKRHIGAPETRPESSACIYSDEKMETYFASSFHGGSSSAYLTMCNILKQNIDLDNTRNITAKWGDESHLNRYLLTYPPVSVLSQSYIFSERCLDLDCREPMCSALREAMRQPVMGSILK
jgi:hypothetical protein